MELTHWEGEPVAVWRSLWGVPLLEVHDLLPSTNDRLMELARDGEAPPFTVVLAEAQSAGRGREGRAWHSPAGLGLWLSVLVPVRAGEGEGPPVLPLRVGVALAEAVGEVLPGAHVGLKWPNDVLLGGRKVAGILCEGVGGEGAVVGVGVNVRQREEDFPPELRATAGSLEWIGGRRISRGGLAAALLQRIRVLPQEPPDRLGPAELVALEALDVLRGRRVRTPDGMEGTARGVDATGALRVEGAGEERRILAGSVEALPPAPAG